MVSRATAATPGPVVVVTGPTTAGKTSLAIEIAQRFDGEVVNADSMQVFRYMDIGTAKPTLEERAEVPHWLFDVVTPDVRYSAGRYEREARSTARGIHERGKLVVLTGGTGLYIRAFLDGLIDSGAGDPELRESLEREHEDAVAAGEPLRLHERLQNLDADAARAIHPNDARRTIRALEIASAGGKLASTLRSEHGFADRPFARLHLAIDPGREIVNERIDARCHAMIKAGLLQEVRALRDRGYGADLRPMQAIGYRHINPVVDGNDTLANAVVAMQRDTRHFARRQRTWIRSVAEAVWLDPKDSGRVMRAVEAFLDVLGQGGNRASAESRGREAALSNR
jgi:tRNA dimethylallyltransferase